MKKLGFASIFIALLSCLLLAHCSGTNKPVNVSPAFFHWRSGFSPDSIETAYLRKLPCRKLYLRFFDVDWDAAFQAPAPVGEAELTGATPDSVEVVPTVFITNRTLLKLSDAQIPELAQHISEKIQSIGASPLICGPIREWQLDCDWTGKSQARYFQLLESLRTRMPTACRLSATIRLHQVKYAERTGIPPVDRGMLMFYNTGEVSSMSETNSILQVEKAARYLDKADRYPIPLDVALPVFHWGVLFREGKLIRLINKLDRDALTDSTRFQQIDSTHFEIRKNTYLEGYFLYVGDQIRLEAISQDQLRTAVQVLAVRLKREDRSVAFYHLDSELLNRYPHALLQTLWQSFTL